MSEHFEASDWMNGARLLVQGDRDEMEFTVVPEGRGVPAQAVSIHEEDVDQLRGWLDDQLGDGLERVLEVLVAHAREHCEHTHHPEVDNDCPGDSLSIAACLVEEAMEKMGEKG